VELGGWSEDRLAEVLSDLAADNMLDGVGWTDDELDDLLRLAESEKTPRGDPGPRLDEADALRKKWDVRPGQLWQLGDHLLLCASSSAETVLRGEPAQLVVTSPPYGVGEELTGTTPALAPWQAVCLPQPGRSPRGRRKREEERAQARMHSRPVLYLYL